MATRKLQDAPSVILRPLKRADAAHIQKWLKDPKVARWVQSSDFVKSKKDAEDWTNNLIKHRATVALQIVAYPENALIGLATLHGIRSNQGVASLGMIVGESDRWRQGYATKAMEKLLSLAFGQLKLEVVEADVMSADRRTIAGLESFGFLRGGQVPSWFTRKGRKRIDKVIYYFTKKQWIRRKH